MATIKDTLDDVIIIQRELAKAPNSSFVVDLMNFTNVIYFEYSAHNILSRIEPLVRGISGTESYYELLSDNTFLKEFIRINNIGQLSVVWNIYEKYLRDKARNEFRIEVESIYSLFITKILPSINVNENEKNKLKQEFKVISFTRNSFHNGGIVNKIRTYYKGLFCNEEYEFTPGQPVKPLRIMDVVKTIWEHYKIIENLNIT